MLGVTILDVAFKAKTLAYLSDRLSLTGFEIFGFEICLENRRNFEEKTKFSDDVDFRTVLSFVCMNQVVFLRGHFGRSFLGNFLGHFGQ